MKEHPILFSGEMVRALLAGKKTQTRRVVKACKDRNTGCDLAPHEIAGEINHGDYENSKYGKPGDRLWVRETFGIPDAPLERKEKALVAYKATDFPAIDFGRWRPSIFMPRWASRITLEITGVRVERLQDISEADALAEGVKVGDPSVHQLKTDPGKHQKYMRGTAKTAVVAYKSLWESINGPGSWAANPWVWVIEFKRVTQ